MQFLNPDRFHVDDHCHKQNVSFAIKSGRTTSVQELNSIIHVFVNEPSFDILLNPDSPRLRKVPHIPSLQKRLKSMLNQSED